MLLELFPFVILNNAMAFVYAYFFSDVLCFDMSILLLTVTLRGVSNKHCLFPFFHCTNSRPRYQVSVYRTIGSLVVLFQSRLLILKHVAGIYICEKSKCKTAIRISTYEFTYQTMFIFQTLTSLVQ